MKRYPKSVPDTGAFNIVRIVLEDGLASSQAVI